MSTTATTACSMCHGSGYTVAGTPCSCGSLANRLTTSNKSDQAHLALLRAELAILRAELRAAEKDRDTWKLRARRMLREDSRFAVIREQESKLTEQAAQIEDLGKDAGRYRGQEWQPIETAPKDGSRIMLGRAAADEQCAVSTLGWWQEGYEDGVDYMGACDGFVDYAFQVFGPGRDFGALSHQYAATQPTHWMPLPAIDAAILGDSHV